MNMKETLFTDNPSPPITPAATWDARLKITRKAWPSVEQIAHLAAALARAFPDANSTYLADKAIELWREAQQRVVQFACESMEREEDELFAWSQRDQSHIPKPAEYPADFEKALRLIVGPETKSVPDRHKKFRDYLSEVGFHKDTFASLKANGFEERDYILNFEQFRKWSEKNKKKIDAERAKRAAAVRWQKNKKKVL